MVNYFWGILIAIDQLGTTLVGGYPDETLSSYAYRLDRAGKRGGRIFRPLFDAMFFWDKDHCMKAYLAERQRHQMPPELRGL